MKLHSAILSLALIFTGPAAAETLYPPADRRGASQGNTTYHIDPANGDDAHSGLGRDMAWRTFRHINHLQLAPGDRVEIIAPGSFDQTLALHGKGTVAEPIEVRFAPGRYDFHPKDLYRETYQISNTNSDPDTPKAVGILLTNTEHMRVSGIGAVIHARGKMIHVCIDGSENITMEGLAFDYHRPTVSEFKVEAIGDDHADLRVHKDSRYTITDGTLTWQGEGWTETTGLAQELDPESGRVHRRRDPLAGLVIKELEPFLIRARGRHDMKPGRIYQIRNPFRDCAGVFVQNSRNIAWRNVHFRFLHGMGMVHQFSENLTFDRVTIAPDPASGRTTAAWADCIQVSGCRGRVLVENCVFSGAHDDAINIHGTHLRVVERLPGNRIKVRFMHPQTFGFPAFHPGDEVEFVHADTLATYGPNRVTAAEMPDPKEMVLTLKHPVPDEFRENDVLENVTWTPEVEIRGCTVSRIPTRGFLITTRRPVLVEDNDFHATHMPGILIENDAEGWFESGCVRDMLIRRNRFHHCGEPAIHINPRNREPNPAVHRNIRIIDNEFVLRGKTAVRAHSTTGLQITGNTIRSAGDTDESAWFQIRDCDEVVIGENHQQQPASS